MPTRAPSSASLVLATTLVPLLAGCGVKERIQERIHQEVAEKVIGVTMIDKRGQTEAAG